VIDIDDLTDDEYQARVDAAEAQEIDWEIRERIEERKSNE